MCLLQQIKHDTYFGVRRKWKSKYQAVIMKMIWMIFMAKMLLLGLMVAIQTGKICPSNTYDSSDEYEQFQPPKPVRRHPSKKILTSNRLVNFIDSCVNPSNLKEISMPQNTMGSNEDETLAGHLGPKSNVNTPKIYWSIIPPSTTGR